METAATLRTAGIIFAFALQSEYETCVPKTRIVWDEAAVAAVRGLAPADALAGITSDAAPVLGTDRRVGSLERSQDAEIALFDDDPFEDTPHVTAVPIGGRRVSDIVR